MKTSKQREGLNLVACGRLRELPPSLERLPRLWWISVDYSPRVQSHRQASPATGGSPPVAQGHFGGFIQAESVDYVPRSPGPIGKAMRRGSRAISLFEKAGKPP